MGRRINYEDTLDVDLETAMSQGEDVETEDYYVGQAYNGHVQVFNKQTGAMMMHMHCSAMYSKEKLQAFADKLQATKITCFEDLFKAAQVLG